MEEDDSTERAGQQSEPNCVYVLRGCGVCVSQMLFWSGTKEVAHQVSEGCYQTMEDSMLGSVLDGKTWCGKEGSSSKGTHSH